MDISRRDLLRLGTGAAALLAAGVPLQGEGTANAPEPVTEVPEPDADTPQEAAEKKRVPVGVQLYSVRQDFQRDPAGVLKALGEMGYEGVEFAGFVNRSAEDLRKMLDDSGLKCCGSHTDLNDLLGDRLKPTIEFNKTLGNKYLMIPSLMANYLRTEENIAETAKGLTDLAEKAKEDGMLIGYHAHDGDFRKIGDRTIWDLLFSQVGPDVCAQIDIGHCVTGGGDPYAELEKFADRAVTIHVTDANFPQQGRRGQGTIVGEGEVDFERIFGICEKAGKTQWYIIEQEVYPRGLSPMDAVKQCLENMRKLGKALPLPEEEKQTEGESESEDA